MTAYKAIAVGALSALAAIWLAREIAYHTAAETEVCRHLQGGIEITWKK